MRRSATLLPSVRRTTSVERCFLQSLLSTMSNLQCSTRWRVLIKKKKKMIAGSFVALRVCSCWSIPLGKTLRFGHVQSKIWWCFINLITDYPNNYWDFHWTWLTDAPYYCFFEYSTETDEMSIPKFWKSWKKFQRCEYHRIIGSDYWENY